jgi:hypothetical protein
MIANWNPLVNLKFSLDGDVHLQEDFIIELKFDSGKRRTWLRNSYVPITYPELSLLLENKTRLKNNKTEFEEFKDWYSKDLRYGSIPFRITRIGFQPKDETKIDETGIYSFLETPKYDSWGHMIIASFGLEETAVIPEVEYLFIAANNGNILLSNDHRLIVANQGR